MSSLADALRAAPVDESTARVPRRRKHAQRAVTVSIRRISKTALLDGAVEYPPEPVDRPRTRGECLGTERPCPFVGCRYHLYLDVNPVNGSIKLNFGNDIEVWELNDTCALDVADRGGSTLEQVADTVNLTPERARQIEEMAIAQVRGHGLMQVLLADVEAERSQMDAHPLVLSDSLFDQETSNA